MVRIPAILIMLLLSATILAQETNFIAQAPRQVQQGQRFRLVYTINSEGTNFMAPEIKNFEVLQGPSYQTGQSTFSYNGKIEYSITTSYSFILEANQVGTFTIPSAVISSKGKRYISNPLTITVSKQNQASPSNNPQTQNRQESTAADRTGNEISIKAIVDKGNPFLGEPITVTYRLYTPVALKLGELVKSPSFPGFWAQNLLKNQTQYKQSNEIVNGKRYIVADLMQFALIPQKSGPLVIDPIEQDVLYAVKVKAQNPFGDDPVFKRLFGDSYQDQEVSRSIRSNPVSILVKPIPSANRPIEFSGAVGQLTLKTETDKNQINTNDAFTYRATISGTGNLCLIEKPLINFPPDFEVYEPKVIDNFKNTVGTSGSRTFEYLIIPRTAGNFKIDPLVFTYFDLNKKDFISLSSNEIDINVLKGNGKDIDATKQESVKYLNNDIRYLMETPLGLFPTGNKFYGTFLYWFILFVLVLAFATFMFFWRRILKNRGDSLLMQRRKATKVAVKRLKKAKLLLDNKQHELFHEEIALALWGYISDKFNIPLAELSMATALESLEKRNVDSEISNKFISTLNDCSFARYAPPGQALNMTQLYELAIEVITQTEQNLK